MAGHRTTLFLFAKRRRLKRTIAYHRTAFCCALLGESPRTRLPRSPVSPVHRGKATLLVCGSSNRLFMPRRRRHLPQVTQQPINGNFDRGHP